MKSDEFAIMHSIVSIQVNHQFVCVLVAALLKGYSY